MLAMFGKWIERVKRNGKNSADAGLLGQYLDAVCAKYVDRYKEMIGLDDKRPGTYDSALDVDALDVLAQLVMAEMGIPNADLAAHVYDITYGSLEPWRDNLVIIDDSIVRGTTLKESIIRILDRLHPKKIILVSSCPQVRYPDYYGIDMARMDEFIAFRAAIELHRNTPGDSIIEDVYRKCKAQEGLPCEQMQNYVKEIYAPYTDRQISEQMVRMLRPEGVSTDISIVFQSLEGLHKACPGHSGDWYFSGDYPTPGGLKLLNRSFINYYEH